MTLVTDVIFPMFKIWTRDFNNKMGVYPDVVAKDYAREIYNSGLNDQAINSGIENFKRSAADKPFTPNPAEFIELCRMPYIEGLPDCRSAYREACANASFVSDANWSHPSVYVAGRICGWFDLRTRPEKDTWPIFKAAYKDVLAKVSRGEDLSTQVPKAKIEHKDIFKADENCAGRLKVMSMLGKLNKSGDKNG